MPQALVYLFDADGLPLVVVYVTLPLPPAVTYDGKVYRWDHTRNGYRELLTPLHSPGERDVELPVPVLREATREAWPAPGDRPDLPPGYRLPD